MCLVDQGQALDRICCLTGELDVTMGGEESHHVGSRNVFVVDDDAPHHPSGPVTVTATVSVLGDATSIDARSPKCRRSRSRMFSSACPSRKNDRHTRAVDGSQSFATVKEKYESLRSTSIETFPPSTHLAIPCRTAFSISGCTVSAGTRMPSTFERSGISVCSRVPYRIFSISRYVSAKSSSCASGMSSDWAVANAWRLMSARSATIR